MRSWRTTTIGILVLIAAIAVALTSLLDGDPTTSVTLEPILGALAGLGLLAARDNGKTSEEAMGIKKTRKGQQRAPNIILLAGILTLAVGCGTVNQQTVDAMGVESQASGANAGFMDPAGNQAANYQGAAPTLIKQDAAGTWATFPGASTVMTFNPETRMVYLMSPKDVSAQGIEYDPATGKLKIASFGARITDVASVQAAMLADALEALEGLTQVEAEARIQAMQAAGEITASVGEMVLEYFVPRLPEE